MSISDVIQVLVASASVAAVVVGIFAIIQGQIQARDALAESRAQAAAGQKLIQNALAESQAQGFANQKLVQDAFAEKRANSLELLYALQRPILVPRAPLGLRNNDLNWDSQHYTVSIKNVGAGVALNIWGVLLPPKKAGMVELAQQYCLRSHVPLSQEDRDIETYFLLEEKKFRDDEMIEKRDGTGELYSLYPYFVDPVLDGVDGTYTYVARLTLTYADVFGRKHASIYDYTNRHRWKFVAHIDDIRKDLEAMAFSKSNQPIVSKSLEASRSEGLAPPAIGSMPTVERQEELTATTAGALSAVEAPKDLADVTTDVLPSVEASSA